MKHRAPQRYGPVRLHGGGGCLTLLLGFILFILFIGVEDPLELDVPLDSEYIDPRGDRRPMPGGMREQFVIEDPPKQQDSQGTAFAIDRDGVWLTAEHVSAGCGRLGLIEGRMIEPVGRALNSRSSDASILLDGPETPFALPLSRQLPERGATGYHMGFPGGQEAMVTSRFMGTAYARRGSWNGTSEPVYVWAEIERDGIGDQPLGGISGGPTLTADGRVIGVNSASSERRGRVLTTAPDAIFALVRASRSVDEQPTAAPLANRGQALGQFRQWLDDGVIKLVFCDV